MVLLEYRLLCLCGYSGLGIICEVNCSEYTIKGLALARNTSNLFNGSRAVIIIYKEHIESWWNVSPRSYAKIGWGKSRFREIGEYCNLLHLDVWPRTNLRSPPAWTCDYLYLNTVNPWYDPCLIQRSSRVSLFGLLWYWTHSLHVRGNEDFARSLTQAWCKCWTQSYEKVRRW